MLIIHRYLLRQFLKSFAIFFVTITGLYVVIDAFDHLDEFILAAETQGTMIGLMGEYYGARLLSEFDRSSGALMLISAMFTVTSLERHNELTALMAAGISKARTIKPLIVAVVVISVVAIANRELAIPSMKDRLSRSTNDLLGTAPQPVQARYDNRTDILLGGKHSIAAQQAIVSPQFRLPTVLGEFGSQIAAEKAYYRAATGEHPAGYLMQQVTQPASLAGCASFYDGDRPVLLSPHDTPWLKANECFVATDVGFHQLAGSGAWRQHASTLELIQGLRNPSLDFGADVRVTVHSRMVKPLLDITLLFLGLPLVLGREQRNVFIAIGLCLVIVAIYFLVVLTCQSLGNNLLMSPALAAWCPLIIFAPVAIGLSEPLRG